MLRIIQSKSVGQAKSYYTMADYYLEGQELTGRWRGEGARLLALKGDVARSDWEQLCDNLDPRTGKRLTLRTDADRTVGYDFNFHVPKSVSLLYAMTRDERLLDAFRDSVDATMQDIEAEMSTRVRKGGHNEERKTGNMTWGEFIHFTSRPVDGVPDPHLHAHCYVFNVTHDGKEQAWKAGQFRDIKRDAPYFEALFHARLAHRLCELGLPVARSKKGWELSGIGKGLIDRFSRRTKQIEDKAKELGIDDAHAKDGLGAKTRESKQKNLSLPELQDSWRGRMNKEELDALSSLAFRIGGDAEPQDENAAARAVEYAIGHEFERKSVTPERQLLATALRRAAGAAAPEQVLDEARRSNLIIGERNGRRMATTRNVLLEEKHVIEFARNGRGACNPLVRGPLTLGRDWQDKELKDEQKRAVLHIAGSRDRVLLLRGAGGVGKTRMMKEAAAMIEAAGTKVFAFAPSADASRQVLRRDGFKDADTVARLLVDENLQRQAAGQLIWIDEAGLLGMRAMAQVFALAENIGARVLLSGDRRQHGSVERGAALRLLEEEAGLKPAELKENRRQESGDYRQAVNAVSEGRVADGFKRLDGLGWIREIANADRDRQLAADYVSSVAKGRTALVISPTHAEGDRITEEIRRLLREQEKLAEQERIFRVLVPANLTEAERGDTINYLTGDVLQFHQNAKGFTRGQRVVVGEGAALPLDQAARFQAFRSRSLTLAAGDLVRITHNGFTADGKHRLNNGSLYRVTRFDNRGNIVLDNGWTVSKDFGHLAYGYVVTSHASQGKSVQDVFLGQSSLSFPASSREQWYVSVSRGKERLVVYTDDKKALQEAVAESDERLSATEFINGKAGRLAVELNRRENDSKAKRPPKSREETSHVR
jgi:conjugative relaxase-like TrwC/TraI family protein